MRLKLITNAAKDYSYLLSRGYRRKIALDFIAQHYGLTLSERVLLLRGIFSKEEIERRIKKIVDIREIYGCKVYIDGFNVLITIMAGLLGENLFLCQDNIIRDLHSFKKKIKISKDMYIALEILLCTLNIFKPSEVYFLFDSPVSYSGIFAGYVRSRIKAYGMKGGASTAIKTDIELMCRKSEIISSSDSLIIEKAEKVVDLAGYIVRYIAPEKIIDLRMINA